VAAKRTQRATAMYEDGLGKNAANHAPLTPVDFLFRAAAIFPRKVAVIHGRTRHTYAQFAARVRRFAHALVKAGLKPGQTVAVMAPNVPAMLEAHYAVPLAGGVLNALNYRLDAASIAFILDHGEAKFLLVDREFAPTIQSALEKVRKKPVVIDIDDPEYRGEGARLSAVDYEGFLKGGTPDYEGRPL
jgi:fatty-acyl-CoA synthase